MRAGNLDRTLTLQRFAKSVSSVGTVTDTWTDYAPSIRAELISPSLVNAARAPTIFGLVETDRPFGLEEEAILTFRVRYLAGVSIADRALYEDNPHLIIGITEIGRRRGLELRCRRVS